jgi:hypothetical protein
MEHDVRVRNKSHSFSAKSELDGRMEDSDLPDVGKEVSIPRREQRVRGGCFTALHRVDVVVSVGYHGQHL